MSETGYRETLRGEIIAKAGALIEGEGLPALQARRIAREAGCAVGTLYNLFGDIDGLVIAVNAETLGMLGTAIGELGGGLEALSLDERLTRLAMAYVDFALSHQRRWEAVFDHRLPPGREAPISYLEDQNRLLGVIEAAIGDWVPEGDGRRGLAARALFGSVHGIVALALDNRLGGRSHAELQQQVKLIVTLAARGLTSEALSRPS
jgi:AcrR family transcriptional regulator